MGEIVKITPGSEAAKAGLQPGMVVTHVNDGEIRDIIQWKQALAFPTMHVAVILAGEKKLFKIRHRSGEEIGIEFASPTLDKLCSCHNNCEFCFVRQMPKGMRSSLYIKDDDYRLSLVYGSFVTLTNVTNEEWQRILREGISPIYVSVHTTNPKLRVELMGNPAAAGIMEQLSQLVAGGITVHVQLVLVPGRNDGLELERSLDDLLLLSPGIESIAVVPVGLTGHRHGLPLLHGFAKDSARAVIEVLEKYRARCRRKFGRTTVYAADEFYILAETDFPQAHTYDDYPQLENGVGLARLFQEEFRQALSAARRKRGSATRVLWVTGMASSMALKRLQHELNARHPVWVDVLPVPNLLFGGGVTVTGLLGGQDIERAMREATIVPSTRVLVPDVTLRQGRFLDDLSVEDLQVAFPLVNISICPTTGGDLVRYTLGLEE
ncbi:MAG: DUF512 domain-containing protein [Firmicutes bacterium]|nr:DUF512 domain-containing protein [Dethiobacter sp.]MBS3889362.1 DUF512 domain-containing protein [Bacillota bacterium]MBS4055308.1 DUF512 domain-containing protein [Thermaerobacter sp.]